ncbi:MAG: TerC/Alx family metal homeostasis membrane protein [Bacteroidales bacterium]|nr:TerC/Alx family metal homeostasis membrane protein [Bacteroidales bacterium]
MNSMTLYWIIFIAVFLAVFIVDFYVTDHRKGEFTVKQALQWTSVWISIALLFGISLFFFFPQNEFSTENTAHIMGIKFISGYLTEYSLSVDNLFVFIMIFSLMGVCAKNQPRLLKLGILLSIVLRILFIVAGMGLVQQFHWIIYIFGIILIWTAYKMAFTKEDDQVDPKNNVLYKLGSKLFPVDPDMDHPHFFSKINGKRHITMFMLVFLVIGSTDVLFAVDSIPAIIGVIKEGATNVLTNEEEQFLAISSNVFAVMGLISLFFALKGIMGMFRFLKTGVSFILFFIGIKMMLPAIGFINKPSGEAIEKFFGSHSWISLTVIVATLLISILLSVIIAEDKKNDDLQDEIDCMKTKDEMNNKEE